MIARFVRFESFTSLPSYRRVRFTRRADIRPMPSLLVQLVVNADFMRGDQNLRGLRVWGDSESVHCGLGRVGHGVTVA
jgi:hypothetical protein